MSEHTESAQYDWRVLTFHGSIHMATYTARDEDDARERAAASNYTAIIQRREVGPWTEALR